MKNKYLKKPDSNTADLISKNTVPIDNRNEELPENMLYPPSEDIFNMDIESNLNPENILEIKQKKERSGKNNEKKFEEDLSGDDLDVPGADLDDKDEFIGSEDEENNYYSLGGDDHNDLDEDKGD
jgi:hypothetical protein